MSLRESTYTIHVCLACGDWEREDGALRALPCTTGGNHGPTKRIRLVAPDPALALSPAMHSALRRAVLPPDALDELARIGQEVEPDGYSTEPVTTSSADQVAAEVEAPTTNHTENHR